MAKSDDNDGCATLVGGAVVGIIVLISMIPKEVWIFLGGLAVFVGLVALVTWAIEAGEKRRAEAEEQARKQRAAQAAAMKKQREESLRKQNEQRVALLGSKNAALVEKAQDSVKRVVASEAARAGWLGDVDFSADIEGITDNFGKAYSLRNLASQLSALDNPSDDDRRILVEAKVTAAELESAAVERVELIGKCASEAALIDKSLQQERSDAKTAEQRAQLHGKLSAMLYGIEATPDNVSADSAADAVMARVRAYQEIKSQIQRSR